MNINYTKMHGLKNDFIIIDSRIEKVSLNTKIIKKIADRKKGIGCDQVVILQKPKKKSASAFIKFYNSDGSHTKACGNAARCVAFLLMKEFIKVLSKINKLYILKTYPAGEKVIKKATSESLFIKLSKSWQKKEMQYMENKNHLHVLLNQGFLFL